MQTVRGEVVEIDARSTGFGKSVVGVLVKQGNEYLRAMWFNQPFMREKFREGQHVLLSGTPRFRGGRWEMPHPRVTWLDGAEDQPEMRLLPLYPLTEGLTQYQVRRMVASALESFGHVLEEVFPEPLLRQYDLMPLAEALPAIHSPQDAEQAGAGAAAVRVSGVVHFAVGGRRAAMAAAGRLSRTAARGIGRYQRPDRAAVSVQMDGRPACGHRRSGGRHGERNADESLAAGRRGQRQDGDRRVRDAGVRRPRVIRRR